MALKITPERSVSIWKYAGGFFAVIAFLIQPLIALNLPAAFAAGIPNSVAINEFSVDNGTDWVELYNTTGAPVDLTGWKLKDSSTNSVALSGSIATHSFVSFNFGTALNQSSDTIILVDEASTTISSVMYGTGGDVAAPATGKYAARTTDGTGAWEIRTNSSRDASNVIIPTTQNSVCASGCEYTTIADAIAGEPAGSTITVKAGTYTISSMLTINKLLTITGESGANITTSGTGYVFLVTASGVTISNLAFTKTDEALQNMIGVQANNFTASQNSFHGQFNIGDGDPASRAFEVSGGVSGLNLSANSLSHLRQAAYINNGVTGTIANNNLSDSKGWVIVSDTNLTFTGNTWSNNATDISIISQDQSVNNYPCEVVASIRANNNNANVDNQVNIVQCVASPTNLTPLNKSYTNDPAFVMSWKAVDGATGYEYRTSHTMSAGALDGIAYSDTSSTQPQRYSTLNGIVTRQNGGTPEDDWYWQVRAIYADDTTGPWSSISKVTTDYTKPTAQILNPAEGAYNPTSYSVSANDNASLNIVTANLYSGSTLVSSCSGRNLDGQTSYTLNCTLPTGLADGTYTVRYNAKDSAGNLSTTRTSSFVIDKKAPIVTINAPTQNTNAKGTVTINGTAADATSGVNQVVVHVRKVKSTGSCDGFINSITVPVVNGSWSTSFDSTTGAFTDGSYCVTVLATDNAGNGNGGGVTLKPFTIDNTKPIINELTYTINGNVHSEGSTPTKNDVMVTIATSEPVQTPNGWTPINNTTFTKTYSSNQTDSVTVKDLAGNMSDAASITVSGIDKVPPTIELNDTTFPGVYTGPVSYSVTDNVQLSTITLSKDGGTGSPVDASGQITQDGVYVLIATDMAGNQTPTSFTIDTTPPSLSINSSDRNNDGTYTIKGTAEPEATVKILIDGQSDTVVAGEDGNWLYITNVLTIGSHTLRVTATDLYGNVTDPQTVSISVTSGTPTVASTVSTLPQLSAVTNPVTVGNNAGGNGTAPQTAGATADTQGEVLGTKTTTPSNSDKVAAIAPSSEGWKLWGIAWYWWLVVLAAIAAVWWLVAGLRRRNNTSANDF